MRIIRPVTITDDILTSTNVAETYDAYDAETTYAKGDIVRDDATHSEHESLQDDNTGNALTDTDWWLYRQATNPWRMFDKSVGSQTANDDSIEVEFQPVSLVDSIALLNISASTARITITASDEGDVYDETVDLVDNSAVVDWFTYFFEPIQRATDLQVTGVSLYAGAEVKITLTEDGSAVLCGACVIGQFLDIGMTGMGASIGIQDYSIKRPDDFGNYYIVERAFSRRGSFPVMIADPILDSVFRTLAGLRATPVVWIGSDRYGSTTIYGFYKDLNVEISYPDYAMCTLELEGLA